MNIWTMIVLIVAICVIRNIVKSRNNHSLNGSIKTDEDVLKLLDRLKKRIENLETIVIEKENTRRFTEID